MFPFLTRFTTHSRILHLAGFGSACIALLLAAGCGKEKAQAPPPPAVEVVEVVRKDVPIYTEWVGTADGLVNATIRAQVTGYLMKQDYRRGGFRQGGASPLRNRPAHLPGRRGRGQRRPGPGGSALDHGQGEPARVKPLAEKNAVSKKDLDDATGAELSSQAAVMSAQAQLDEAQLDLSFTRITSPMDGIAGIAKAQIGNLVGPGQIQELTTVSTVDPIKVTSRSASVNIWISGRESGMGEIVTRRGSRQSPGIDPGRRNRLPSCGNLSLPTGRWT